MSKYFLCLGALMGFISVAAGAFGAHALKQRLTHEMLSIFEVGARYQMYHALALILVALLAPSKFTLIAGWSFFAGTILFSGSLYALSLTGLTFFGAIAPIGGTLLLIGWGCLAFAWKNP